MTEAIQSDLIERNLKPDTYLVDVGDVEAEADLLAESRECHIDLVGPAPRHKQR